MSALCFICTFSNQISDNCNIIHPHVQADHHVLRKQFKTCCDLEKISRSPNPRNLLCARVIYLWNSGMFQIYWQKNRYYLAHVCQFKTCVTLKIQSESQI